MSYRLQLAAAAILGIATAAQAGPTITAGQIVSTTVDVTKPQPAPIVKLQIKGLAGTVQLIWTGPSGQFYNEDFTGGAWEGATLFQGNPLSEAYFNPFFSSLLNLYTQPGTWTLSTATICANIFSTCTSYTGSSLSSLFASLTLQITNPNTPDYTPPTVTAAVIDTPNIKLSADPNLKIGLALTDDLSGIGAASVCANTSSNHNEICVESTTQGAVSLARTLFMTTALQSSTVTGTYTVTNISTTDFAGNSATITDAATISKLFHGKVTFTVSN